MSPTPSLTFQNQPTPPHPQAVPQLLWGDGGCSDFDFSPEGLLDVLDVLAGALLSLDGQGAVPAQGRSDGSGVHILRQLAFVGEGVHDGPVRCQLSGAKREERGVSGGLDWGRLVCLPFPSEDGSGPAELPATGIVTAVF